MSTRGPSDAGFSAIELTIVLVLIGILITLAAPIYLSSRANATKRSCFATQRTLEGAAEVYLTMGDGRIRDMLVGQVNASHPLVADRLVLRAPSCPAAPRPADPANPTSAEGAYTFDVAGRLTPCVFGEFGPHGHY